MADSKKVKKEVPFYANTSDGTHCVQASFRSMLKYFLPERDFSWEELDSITHKSVGKGTWWFPGLISLSELGLDVLEISPFNYQKFYTDGAEYVQKTMKKDVAEYYLNQSNLMDVKELVPKFLATVEFRNRKADVNDISILLDDGYLVGLDVNSRILNHKDGYSSHMVTVFDYKENKFRLHDPGLPAIKNFEVSTSNLLEAWQYAGDDQTSLVAIRKH